MNMRKISGEISFGALILMMVIGFGSNAFAQTEPSTGDAQPKGEKPAVEEPIEPQPATSVPAITSLAGLSLDMSADEARDKLGKPDVSDKTGMLFTPSSTESVQIGLDANGKVRTIALIYTDGDKKAPSFEEIFGTEVSKPDSEGDVYKLVRYPEANLWISYSLTNSDKKATTIVTIRRLN